jgi:hypothetical protein
MQAPLGPSRGAKALLERLYELETDASTRKVDFAAARKREAEVAAVERMIFEQEALEKVAGEAAAAMKVYRAWQRVPGEFDGCDQIPVPGQVLSYFSTKEGIKGRRADPLLAQITARASREGEMAVLDRPSGKEYAIRGIYGTEIAGEALHDDAEGEEDRHVLESEHSSGVTKEATKSDATLGISHALSNLQTDETSVHSPLDQIQSKNSPLFHTKTVLVGGKKLPKLNKTPRAGVLLNNSYLSREYPMMHLSKTSSASLIRAQGKDDVEFVLGCDALDFGIVPLGSVVIRKVSLQNVSLERARFAVDRMIKPFHLKFQRAPVPAGLRTYIFVEFSAEESGPFESAMTVRSAINIMQCRLHGFVEGTGKLLVNDSDDRN